MAYATPLAAYLDQRTANEKESLGNLQQAGALQTMLSQAAAQQREAKAREIMASNASPEDKFTALAAISPQHAHQFATGLKEMQALKMNQAVQGALGGETGAAPSTDPATLRKVAQAMIASGHPGGAPLLAEAERRQKEAHATDLAGTMRSRPAIQPDPQEVAQAADQGTPPVAAVPAQPGVFSTLAQSKNASIATSAKNLQAQFDALKAPNASQVAYFDRARDELTRRQDTFDQQDKMLQERRLDRAAAKTTDPSVMLDKDALETAGWEKLLFGTDAKGMGKASSEQRKQIAEERTRIGKGLGLSPMEISMMPQDNKVKMKAVDALTKWGAFVDKGAEQLIPSIDLAISYAQKMDQTKLQTLNKAILAGRTEFNDPNANAYAVAVNTVRREYGRLMSGPTSNAMLPVEAMKQGDHLISTALDLPAWNEVKNVILQDAGFTKAAVKRQIDTLHSSMLPPGAAPAVAPPATPAPAAPSGWSIKPSGG